MYEAILVSVFPGERLGQWLGQLLTITGPKLVNWDINWAGPITELEMQPGQLLGQYLGRASY